MKKTLKTLAKICKRVALLCLLVFLFPIFWLFAQLTKGFKTGCIKVENGKVQVATTHFIHPVTRRRVIFVGVMHIGKKAFYKQIQELIDKYEAQDYRVLYEGVRHTPEGIPGTYSEKEKQLINQLEMLSGFTKQIACILKLQYQKDGLRYPGYWFNTDISEYELVRLMVSQNINLLKDDKPLDSDILAAHRIVRWVCNTFFAYIVPLAITMDTLAQFSTQKRKLKNIILNHRNAIALEGIKNIGHGYNLITIWGAAHYFGIAKGLKKLGYQEEKKEWFTAYKLRRYRFISCLKRDWSSLAASHSGCQIHDTKVVE